MPLLSLPKSCHRPRRAPASERGLAAIIAVALLLTSTALVRISSAAASPSIDARAGAVLRAPRELTAAERRLVRAGSAIRYHERSGVPTFVWTSPSPGSEQARRRARRGDPAEEARLHLHAVASLYGLGHDDIGGVRVSQVHDTGSGGVVVKFRAGRDGVEVFGEEIAVLMNRDLERVAVSGFVSKFPESQAGTAADPFATGGAAAVAAALADRLSDPTISAGDITAAGPTQGAYSLYGFRAGSGHGADVRVPDPLRAKPVYFHAGDSMRPAYYVEVAAELPGAGGGTDSDVYAYVAAVDGSEVLFRSNLTLRAAFQYRVWSESSPDFSPRDPLSDTMPHPTGIPYSGYAPAFVLPSLVTVDGLNSNPMMTFDPWLSPSATSTLGNNADAYADLAPPNGFDAGDHRAPVSAPGVFDYTYNTSLAPGANLTQKRASTVQAFYGVNVLHDFFYDAGFDEAAGNAQDTNYGRGGLEGDRLLVEVQDYNEPLTSSLTAAADGASPRLQLGVWNGALVRTLGVNTQPGSPPLPSAFSPLGLASFGADSFTTTADVVLVDDGDAPVSDGCEAPFVNAGAVSGKIALIDRGGCDFAEKAENAIAAGAVGVLIANNTGGTTVSVMTGACSGPCPVGVLMLTQNQGTDLTAALEAGIVNVTMQRTRGVQRDSAIDAHTVAHEWGHYLSTRLIGDGSGLATVQSQGLGEGWSDFNAILLAVKHNDDWSGTFAPSPYLAAGLSNDAPYFGLRRVPYSTDMTKNPLTFGHIEDGVAIAGAVCDFDCDGSNNSEVHNAGEIWATMLWECYAALLGDTQGMSPRMTFQQARQRMRGYLVASLKMTPVNPTFTEARDALLAVAGANDVADEALFCDAFAKRGLGQGASAPDRFSLTNAGVVESFVCALPPDCPSAPRNDCNTAPAGRVQFQGNLSDPEKQKMSWNWKGGTSMGSDLANPIGEFGDPVGGGTSYRLCVYDDGVLENGALVPAGGTCDGKPCWTEKAGSLTYKSKAGNADGVSRLKIKARVDKVQIQLKGKGSGLSLAFPIAGATGVTLQLLQDPTSGGKCWSTEFLAPATKHDPLALKFRDKLP